MAYHFAVARLQEHRTFPEGLRQRGEADRCVEAFACLDHLDRHHVAAFQNFRQVITGIRVSGCNQGIDIGPVLSPNIAEKMRRERTVCRNDVAVFVAKLHTHIGMELQIQRPNLAPQPVQFFRELIRRHVVFGSPHGAGVRKAEFFCAFVR